MGVFVDGETARRYLGKVFEEAMADPKLGPKFADSGVVLKLSLRDPEVNLTVDMPKRTVLGAGDGQKPTVEIITDTDTAHRFWLGKVNISLALAKGEMRAKGPIQKIIKLVPIARELFPRYREMLAREGRNDLIE